MIRFPRCVPAIVVAIALITSAGGLRAAPVFSDSYPFPSVQKRSDRGESTQVFFSGETTLLAKLGMSVVTLDAHNSILRPAEPNGDELLLLVKQGRLAITLAGETRVLGPGSIALILPGDSYTVAAGGSAPVTYFQMSYRSKAAPDPQRGRADGNSFVVDFEDLEFQPHDRGGLRNYFNRATTMTENFEMHVTTLKEGITSHPPHTHRSEEIILMIHGEAEELINGEPHALKTGDFAFLDSMVPHGIRNTGAGTCMYFAFQWR